MATNTVRKLDPAIDASPADGLVDPLSADIQAEQASVTAWDDDEFSDTLRPLAMQLLNSEERARRLIWRAADKHHQKMVAGKAMLDFAAAEAGKVAARAALARDQEMAARHAAQSVLYKAQQATTQEVAARYADDAAKCGADFESSFRTLADAFDQAWGQWVGPDAFRAGEFTLADIYVENSLANEIRSSAAPMSDALITFQRLKEGGDEKKIATFVRAARAVAREIRQTPRTKLSDGADSTRIAQQNSGAGQQDMADTLLRAFVDYKKETQPPSLAATANLLGTARQHAFVIFGTSGPNYSVLAEFQITGRPVSARDSAISSTPWVPSPSFFTKYLPPLRTPGGWSPPIMRSSGGGVVRLPATRDQ